MTTNGLDREVLEHLARRFETPLYVYDAASIVRRHAMLASCLPAGMRLFYAVKANPLGAILRILRELGCGAEVGSDGELRLALSAGYPPDAILYTCPGKTREGVELALESGIRCTVLESLEEAALVDATARSSRRVARVAIRINPSVATTAALAMSGGPMQFGFDEEDLAATLDALARFRNLAIIGIQVYAGTQILHADHLVETAARILQLAVELRARHEIALDLVDLGGGFGIPYRPEDRELDLAELRAGYRDLAARHPAMFERGCVVAESGRFLVGDAGVFLTRVVARKRSRGRTFVICDGGYPSHSAALHIARTGEHRYPIEALARDRDRERVTVTGPTGTPVDLLAREVELESVQAGDLLAVGRSGAYGYTNSCQLFFTRPSPAEVLVRDGQIIVVRERGKLVDLQRGPA